LGPQFGAASAPFFAVNNAVVVLAVLGVANLWAQAAMKARDLAALATALIVYDVVATWHLPLMDDLFGHLAALPFAPLVAWPIGDAGGGRWLAVGFGHLLLAAAFPPVARKAFGRPAGLTAMVLALGTLAMVFAFPPRHTFPVMIVLGPLTVLQYAYWARCLGHERTTWQYAQAEPVARGDSPPYFPTPAARIASRCRRGRSRAPHGG
jgi:hypothetical protein